PSGLTGGWDECPVPKGPTQPVSYSSSSFQQQQPFCHPMRYHMLETTMYVRCAHCGYDNSPEDRFCGMCGASLAHPPAPVAAPPARAVAPSVNSREADFRANELRG